ncbi:allograft inflammatory factor 1 [Nematostella vectensis]|uniref:allograft inflammatory factor 1 n=1 Tax=Nematostella vectensis TaxID=45351 RepID=UPI00207758BD|nr:allograft inflammatory factor 1 [Nematostella vectensis]
MEKLDHQGGKLFGEKKKKEEKRLDEINQKFLDCGDYDDEEEFPNLKERLKSYKKQFMEYDTDCSGEIDIVKLKLVMEKLGQAKTHLELKKMIAEIDTTDSGTIFYNEFVTMMLGKSNAILKIILMFEEMKKEQPKPTGYPPKRDLSSLP